MKKTSTIIILLLVLMWSIGNIPVFVEEDNQYTNVYGDNNKDLGYGEAPLLYLYGVQDRVW